LAYSQTGILIYGNPESIIENVSLDRVQLNIDSGEYSNSYGGNFDLRPAQPLSLALYKHDIPGIYAQYVYRLTISGFELNWGRNLPDYFTNGVEVTNFSELSIRDFNGTSAFPKKEYAAIKLADGSNVNITGSIISSGTSVIKERVK
jgi:hypothetical protein